MHRPPAVEYWPLPQLVHVVDPPLLDFPARQLPHVVALTVALYVPAGQLVHTVAPAVSVYFPAGQPRHAVALAPVDASTSTQVATETLRVGNRPP